MLYEKFLRSSGLFDVFPIRFTRTHVECGISVLRPRYIPIKIVLSVYVCTGEVYESPFGCIYCSKEHPQKNIKTTPYYVVAGYNITNVPIPTYIHTNIVIFLSRCTFFYVAVNIRTPRAHTY